MRLLSRIKSVTNVDAVSQEFGEILREPNLKRERLGR